MVGFICPTCTDNKMGAAYAHALELLFRGLVVPVVSRVVPLGASLVLLFLWSVDVCDERPLLKVMPLIGG